MGVIEKIQAAIEKLERLKVEATPGRWFLTYERATHPRVWGNAEADDADQVAQAHSAGSAELIVTLHRTIDAQLAMLTDALERFNTACCDKHGLYGSAPAIAFAESIIGTPS